MSEDASNGHVASVPAEGPPQPKSTPSRPPIDETWTEVQELPEADDSEYTDEEVEYIALDLGRDFPVDTLKQVDSIQLTNLNKPEPWIRVGPHILRGRHDRMLGSDLIFDVPPADPDTGKAENVTCIASTQARVRFQPVTLSAKSTGNPSAPIRNASSYLAPKIPAVTNRPGVSRNGRGRGRGRGRGKASSTTAGRDGSVASSTVPGDNIGAGDEGNDDQPMDGEQSGGQADATPDREEF